MTTPTPAAFDSEDLARRADAVRALARHLLRDGADADDAAQEAWLVAMQRSPRADVPFAWWMRGVVRNVAMHLRRSAATRQRHESASLPPRATEAPDTAVERTETQQRLVAAVLALDEPYRTTLILRYFEDRSAAEIGRSEGVPAATVRSRTLRALELLRARLDRSHDGDRRAWAVLLLPVLAAGRASRFGRGGVAAALLLASAAIGIAVTASGDAIVVAAPGVGAAEPAAAPRPRPVAPAAARGRGAREQLPEDAPAPAAPSADLAPADAGDAADAARGATGIAVEVVDEDGARVPSGVVEIQLADVLQLADFGVERFAQYEDRLGETPISDANPIVFRDLPREMQGLAIEVTARVPGVPPSEPVRVTIRAGDVAEVRLVAARARTAAVLVVDRATGEPIPDATVVSATELDRRGITPASVRGTPGPGSAVTAADGRCIVGELGRGTHTLVVDAPGHVRHESEWTGDPVTVRLAAADAGCRLTVRVLAPDGSAVEGMDVRLVGTDRVARTDAAGVATFEAVPSGFQSVAVDIGAWAVLRKSRGWDFHDETRSGNVSLGPGGTAEITLGFVPGERAVEGRVVAEDGSPLAGVGVRLVGARAADGTTDASGTVRFDRVPKGRVSACVTYRGTHWWFIDAKSAGERAGSVEWRLGASTVTGRVVAGTDRVPVAGASVYAGSGPVAIATTDARGGFRIEGARAGACDFEVHTADAGCRLRGVAVPGSADVELALVPYGHVAVRFAVADRERLHGAAVVVRADGEDGEWALGDGKGADDLVSPGLLPGRYAVEVALGGRTRRFAAEVVSGATSSVEVTAP